MTRPKPPCERQGLAESWGKDTVRQVHFWTFSTFHFALSSGVLEQGNPTDALWTKKVTLQTGGSNWPSLIQKRYVKDREIQLTWSKNVSSWPGGSNWPFRCLDFLDKIFKTGTKNQLDPFPAQFRLKTVQFIPWNCIWNIWTRIK